MPGGQLKSSVLLKRELELKRKDDVWDNCEKVGMDGMTYVEEKAKHGILVEEKNPLRKCTYTICTFPCTERWNECTTRPEVSGEQKLAVTHECGCYTTLKVLSYSLIE